jgi:hypothetical protein
MTTISPQENKLLTLSLLLRTMPKSQQSILLSHFSPNVARKLAMIEHQTANINVENLDWTPFYRTWPGLKKIVDECKSEIKQQELVKYAEEQRPLVKEYILTKLGMKRPGAPIVLSAAVKKVIDQFLTSRK